VANSPLPAQFIPAWIINSIRKEKSSYLVERLDGENFCARDLSSISTQISVSQQRIGLAPISGVADLYLNPTVFVDGDGSSTKHHFFVVAGSASEISSDIEPRILIAQYQDGQVKTDDGTNYTYTSLEQNIFVALVVLVHILAASQFIPAVKTGWLSMTTTEKLLS